MLLLWFHSIPFLLRTLPRADMESAPTVCQSRNILPAANFGGVGGTPPYILPEKGNVGRPALWPPCPLPATANLPCNPPTLTPQTKASLVKGRCRACEAEGFLPVCGCDSVQGIARRNPSGRLRRPPAPLLALRATSPGTGESVFDKEGFSAPTLNFTSNFTLAKSGKVCYNLIAYRFSGKYSRNPNPKRRVPPHVRTPVGNPCGFLW